MAAPPLKISVAAPVFAAAGHGDLRTPNLTEASWELVRDVVLLAEDLGLHAAWFSDHLFLGRDGAFFEPWTSLSALAGSTRRIRLVTNHLNNNFRPAPLIAKMAATVDVVSGGRFELFLSPGLREQEHVSYGFGWESDPAVRTRRLAEALEVVRALWTGLPVDFDGTYYQLRGALCTPAPRQSPGPPLWVGGILDEVTTELICAQADGWNSFPASLDSYADLAARVDEACLRHGRDPRSLVRSLETQVLVLDHPDQLDSWLDRWEDMRNYFPSGDASPGPEDGGVSRAELRQRYRDQFVIGTLEEVADKLAAYQTLGVNEVVCWFMDLPELTTMRAVATLGNAVQVRAEALAPGRVTTRPVA
jgi:alkanesulfonate monooxygenase SsuD/methylene tetrahydromethanopterin reductase-like flavin-dependent oxidoreductase (luciferase family)